MGVAKAGNRIVALNQSTYIEKTLNFISSGQFNVFKEDIREQFQRD